MRKQIEIAQSRQPATELDKKQLSDVICSTVSSHAPQFTGVVVSRNMQRMFDFTLLQAAAPKDEVLALQNSSQPMRTSTMYGTGGQCSNCR